MIFITSISCKNNKNEIIKNNIITTDTVIVVNDFKIKDLKFILGKWTWQSSDESQQFTIDFIKFSNDSIYAKYCAVYNFGDKMDCDFDETINNIHGVVENNRTLKLKFNSFFEAKSGVAEIIINDTELQWKIISDPIGEFYAPSECILKRKEVVKVDNNKVLNLPFDFENLKTCSEKCDQIYPKYKSTELPDISKISLELTQYEPEVIYMLNNGDMKFQTFVVQYSGDAISQTLINVKDGKLISSQDIGYEMSGEDESYQSFIIDTKLNIDIIDINYKTKLSKVLKKFKITLDGKIRKIK